MTQAIARRLLLPAQLAMCTKRIFGRNSAEVSPGPLMKFWKNNPHMERHDETQTRHRNEILVKPRNLFAFWVAPSSSSSDMLS